MRVDYGEVRKNTDPDVAAALETAFDYVSSIDWIEGRGTGDGMRKGQFEATPDRRILNGFGTTPEGVRYVTMGNKVHTKEHAGQLANDAVTDCVQQLDENAGWMLVLGSGTDGIEAEHRVRIREASWDGAAKALWIHRWPTNSGHRTSLRRVEINKRWPGTRCQVGPAARHVMRKLVEWAVTAAAEEF